MALKKCIHVIGDEINNSKTEWWPPKVLLNYGCVSIIVPSFCFRYGDIRASGTDSRPGVAPVFRPEGDDHIGGNSTETNRAREK